MKSFEATKQREGSAFSLHPKGIAFWLPILFLMLCTLTLSGQKLKPQIKNFLPEDYNGPETIYSAAKDSNGVLYFGTKKGQILKYNGSKWRKILVKAGMSITSLKIDSKGRIWVTGYDDFGYMQPRFQTNQNAHATDTLPENSNQEGQQLQFVSLKEKMPDTLQESLKGSSKTPIYGKVFWEVDDCLLVYSGGDLKTVKPFGNGFKGAWDIIGPGPKNKQLWLWAEKKGILTCDIEKNKTLDSTSFKSLAGSQFFKDIRKRVSTIIPMEEEEVLIATWFRGLYKYQIKPNKLNGDTTKTVISRFAEGSKEKLTRAGVAGGTTLDPQKNSYHAKLAINSYRGGIFLFDDNENLILNLDQKEGIAGTWVGGWLKTNGSHLWYATRGGISKVSLSTKLNTTKARTNFNGEIVDLTYYNNKIFMGARAGGLYALNKTDSSNQGSFKQISAVSGANNKIHTAGNKLFFDNKILEKQNKEWSTKEIYGRYPHSITKAPKFFPKNSLNQETLVVGSEAIALWQKTNGRWQSQLDIEDLPDAIGSLAFEPKLKNDSAILWGYSYSEGIIRVAFDKCIFKKKEQCTNQLTQDTYTISHYDTTAGLPKNSGITPNKFNDRVIFSTDKGLYRAKKRGKGQRDSSRFHFVPDSTLGPNFLPKSAGGTGKAVTYFKEKNNGNVWLQSDQLYHFIQQDNGYQMDTLPFQNMDIGEVQAICEGKSSNITWIGGTRGLAKYDSDVEKNYKRDYTTVINRVAIPKGKESGGDSTLFFGKFYKRDSTLSPPWKVVQDQPKAMIPELPLALNKLQFNFAAPYFEGQEAMQYSYKLKGYDDDWSDWSKRTFKEYSYLPTGQYTFQVKARNIYNHESEVASYQFVIEPPFYRTAWFYGGQAGLLLFLAVVAIYLARRHTGRATKYAIPIGTVVIFLVFEYCQNYVEVYMQDYIGGVVVFKIALNILVITLLIPFRKLMERLLLLREKRVQKEGAKNQKVAEFKAMHWDASKRWRP